MGLCAYSNDLRLWFFQGAFLCDRDGVLIKAQEGSTEAPRKWRFSSARVISRSCR